MLCLPDRNKVFQTEYVTKLGAGAKSKVENLGFFFSISCLSKRATEITSFIRIIDKKRLTTQEVYTLNNILSNI